MLTVGARVGYYQGDVKKLVDDIAVLKPTIFLGAHAESRFIMPKGFLCILKTTNVKPITNKFCSL